MRTALEVEKQLGSMYKADGSGNGCIKLDNFTSAQLLDMLKAPPADEPFRIIWGLHFYSTRQCLKP